MRCRAPSCILAAALLATLAVSSHAASHCPPGWGLKNFNILGVLGGIISGNPSTSEPRCQPCGAWEASEGGLDAKCELCVPGLSTPNAFNTACDCVPGTYWAPTAEGLYPSGVKKDCLRCPEGSVSSTTNAKACTQCPAGTVPGKNNKCTCPAGFRATGVNVDGASGCIKCDEGLVSPGGLSTTCTTCPDYSIPLPSGDYCGCLPGTKLESSEPFKCAACATVFEYTEAPNRLFMCQQCYPFSYANKNHTACECTGGYYSTNPTAQPVRCRSCPTGTYKSGPGNDISLCLKCPEGLEPSGSGRQCVKPLCPAGTETAADGSCIKCDETHFNRVRNGTCQPCQTHTLASPDRTKCDICVHGYLQTSEPGEDLACNGCMVGWKWDAATSTCVVDDSVPTGTEPLDTTLPADDAWMRFIPQILASQGNGKFAGNANSTHVKRLSVVRPPGARDRASATANANVTEVTGANVTEVTAENV